MLAGLPFKAFGGRNGDSQNFPVHSLDHRFNAWKTWVSEFDDKSTKEGEEPDNDSGPEVVPAIGFPFSVPKHEAEIDYVSGDVGMRKDHVEMVADPRNAENGKENEHCQWWDTTVLS
jgi:hypothetical protein